MYSDTVCLLTDYGLSDEFAGVLHRVITRLAPAVRVIDVTHQVPAHDVRAGALTLWRAAPYLVPAVILAVVDPGVATDRRAVALAAGPAVLVGPDNGLLLPAALALGGVQAAVELSNPAYHLPVRPGTGGTFAGRDVFAPVAAHLAAGVALDQVGTRLDSAQLVGDPLHLAVRSGGHVEAEVLWVDHFGNAQLNVTASEVAPFGPHIDVDLGGPLPMPATVADAYSRLPPGAVGLVPDSVGLLALCMDRRSAALALGLRAGAPVTLGPG